LVGPAKHLQRSAYLYDKQRSASRGAAKKKKKSDVSK
jgi:hypothetical protein